MKILVPVDGSKPSLHALKVLGTQGTFLGDNPDITILNVQPPIPARICALEQPEGVKDYYRAEAGEVMEKVTAALPPELQNAHMIYRVGHPAEVIAEEAEKLDVDLIIMGSHGHRALGALLFGSVSNEVLANVKRPTLIVRDQIPADLDGLKIGVAVDGSPYSERAIQYLIDQRELFGPKATLTLIHASTDFSSIVMPSMAGVPIRTMNRREVSELQSESFEMALKPLKPMLDKEGIVYSVAHVQGNPGDAIAKYAREHKLDLIVMGSHGYNSIDAVLLGSVAMRIAAISKEPLLIIR